MAGGRLSRIRRRAQKQGATILWLDEVGARSTHQAGATYAPRSKTPVLEKTGKRFGIKWKGIHRISAKAA